VILPDSLTGQLFYGTNFDSNVKNFDDIRENSCLENNKIAGFTSCGSNSMHCSTCCRCSQKAVVFDCIQLSAKNFSFVSATGILFAGFP
jgi:hypothetical protein